MMQLKLYMPFTLFTADKAQNLEMQPFDQMDKCKNLANALSKVQEKEMNKCGWDVYGMEYAQTLTKLASLELRMREMIKEQKKIDAISKAQQKEQDKKSTKRDSTGKAKS